MPDVWLISGIPGAGKTTAGRLLASRLERSAFIEGDLLAQLIVAGRILPGDEPFAESEQQIRLCIHNQCLLARSFVEAGFDVVIDHPIVIDWTFAIYRQALAGLSVHYVVLHPDARTVLQRDEQRDKSREHKQRTGRTLAEQWLHLEEVQLEHMSGYGLWLDNTDLSPEQTVDAILVRRESARLSPDGPAAV